MAAHRKLDRRHDDVCGGGLGERVLNVLAGWEQWERAILSATGATPALTATKPPTPTPQPTSTPSPQPTATANRNASSAPCARAFLILGDDAKQTVFFVGDSSGEKDSACLGEQIPQALKLEWRAIGAHERLDKSPRDGIVIVDEAVTEIADPEFAVHESKSPWGVEVAVRN